MKRYIPAIVALCCLQVASAQTLAGDNVTLKTGLGIDHSDSNKGTLDGALTFGRTDVLPDPTGRIPGVGTTRATGEGIASKRTPGGNQYGLDLYSGGLARISVTRYGLVGVGTSTPSRQFEVHGPGDVELGVQTSDPGGRLWTVGTSGINHNSNDGNFQIIDRIVNFRRLVIDTTGMVTVNTMRVTGGSDIAEPFTVPGGTVEPGSVMVIDDEHAGKLKLSSFANDRRVAGVVSGAGGIQPGLTLAQVNGSAGERNVTLVGRAYALADATDHPIHPGDLLTTSSTPGHCKKVVDYDRARGAILGKAMSSLERGRGSVLVLITLQ